MQHISVILAHPYTHSLNAAIAATVVSTLEKNGYSVHFHDLYQEGFDPLLSGEELAAGKSNDPLLTSTSSRNQPCARHYHRPPQLVGTAARYPQRLDGACSAEKRRLHLSTGR